MFGLPTLKLALAGGAAASLIALGAGLDRTLPVIGANAAIARVSADRDAWRASSVAWRQAQADTRLLAVAWAGSFREAKALRIAERVTAIGAVDAAARSCDARVSAARRSAAAIHSLVTQEVPRDPQGCPVRQLLDPRRMRDALTPPG